MQFDKTHPYLNVVVWNNDVPSLVDDHVSNGVFMSYLKLQTDRHDIVVLNFLDDDGPQHNAFYAKLDGTYQFHGWDKEGASLILTDRFEEVSDIPTNSELLLDVSHLFASCN